MARRRLAEVLKVEGFWDNLSPNQRRGAVVVSGVAGLLLFLSLITGDDEASPRGLRDNIKRSVLTDANTRSIGIDALNAKVRLVESDNDRLKRDLDRVMAELKDVKRRRGNDPDVTRQMAILEGQLKNLTRQAQTLGWEVDDIRDGYYDRAPAAGESDGSANKQADKPADKVPATVERPVPVQTPAVAPRRAPSRDRPGSEAREEDPADPRDYFRRPPVQPVRPAVAATPVTGVSVKPADALVIYTAESVPQAPPEPETDSGRFLPAGSIISGVLLNGMDAATGRGARKDPYPVLVRVQKEAILPNLYQADVTECFATLAGYGELSSERAFLRGEKFSCITRQGDVIERNFPGYAVGEDGKAGIRGRLVTKSGSLLAKAALAGVSAGIAQAFNTSPVPVIQTSDVSSDKVYQDNFSTDAVRHGVSTGASSALNRLADYYMDMADQIFPVIEIDAGRRVDIVLTNGFKLSLKGE